MSEILDDAEKETILALQRITSITQANVILYLALNLLDANSFVHTSHPHTFMSNSKLPASNPDLCGSNSIAKSVSMRRGVHTASYWKAPSIAAVSEALPGVGGIHSEDAKLLLVLLCFLASSEVPLDLLFRGASPRKRWNEHGEIEEADALYSGLRSELVYLLSSMAKLSNAFRELVALSAVSRNSDQTYIVDQAVLACGCWNKEF